MKTTIFLIIMLTAIMPLTFSDVLAKDIVLLADNYSTCHNEGLSDIIACGSGCLYGLDFAGDWVEYTFSTSEFGTHATLIYVQGMLDTDFHLQMTLTANDFIDVQTFDFNFSGVGFG